MTDRQVQRADEPSAVATTTRRQVVKGAISVGTGVAAAHLMSGVAAAHFPVQLDIDVQPRNAADFIDLDAHESVRVAVFPSEYLNSDGEHVTFDPTEEAARYRFGSRFTLQDGSGARPTADGEVTSVDRGHGESQQGFVLEFPVAETGFDGEEETAWLYWERDESGEHGLAGVDAVRVYSPEPSNRELLRVLRRLLDEQT